MMRPAFLGMAAMLLASCAAIDNRLSPPACGAGSLDVYFDADRTELTPEARRLVDAFQDRFNSCHIDEVVVVGMASAAGEDPANDELSKNRAAAIASAMQARGWPAERFTVLARGEAGATVGSADVPMRRRATVNVKSSPR